MRTASMRKLTVGAVAAGLVLTGCGTTAEGGSASDSGDGPISGLRFMVPNSPGSGYDTTARAVAAVMEEEEIAEGIEVFNAEGAGGTVGLQRLVNEDGNADMLMQMGLGVVGAQFSNQSEATLDQTTPVAKLIEEAEAIVVPGDSPFQSLDDLVAAWEADPGNTPVGGASNPGGPDHLTPMLLAQEVGVDPTVGQLRGLRRRRRAAGRHPRRGRGIRRDRRRRGDRVGRGRRRPHPGGHQRGARRGRRRPDAHRRGRRPGVRQLARHRGAPRASPTRTRRSGSTRSPRCTTARPGSSTLEDNGWTDAFLTGDEFTLLPDRRERAASRTS